MGAPAYKYDSKMELITTVLTSFLQNKYYESANEEMERLEPLINKDPLFAAKLGIYARNEFGMRSISHFIAGEIGKVKGQPWTRNFFNGVVRRADDMTEILAYHLNKYGKPIPNAMKRGLADALNRFDAYQLAKYRGEGKKVKLIDLINLIHPKTTHAPSITVSRDDYLNAISQERREQIDVDNLEDTVQITPISALVLGLLKSTETWESKLTEAGKDKDTEKKKEEAWVDLVKNKKLPYFAALRNLRNIIFQAPEVLDQVCDIITNRKMLEKSLVLPFRFLAAYNEIEKISEVDAPEKHFESEVKKVKNLKDKVDQAKAAIENALNYSVHNLPKLEGRTLILTDNSGSMRGDSGGGSPVSAMSKIKSSDIGNLFSMLYWMKCSDTLVGLFGDKLLYPKLDRDKSVFENFKTVDNTAKKCGAATESGIYVMFDRMIKEKIHVDTCVIFSDFQIGDGNQWYTHPEYFDGKSLGHGDFNKLYERYRKEVNPNIRTYSIDLRGYGTNVFNNNVFRLAGWSEKIFDLMKIMEQDKKALIKKIESIEI
ncbi:MAG: TROVE domain-containing protein [Candidatus Heimdallarchaeaceae archaeon]